MGASLSGEGLACAARRQARAVPPVPSATRHRRPGPATRHPVQPALGAAGGLGPAQPGAGRGARDNGAAGAARGRPRATGPCRRHPGGRQPPHGSRRRATPHRPAAAPRKKCTMFTTRSRRRRRRRPRGPGRQPGQMGRMRRPGEERMRRRGEGWMRPGPPRAPSPGTAAPASSPGWMVPGPWLVPRCGCSPEAPHRDSLDAVSATSRWPVPVPVPVPGGGRGAGGVTAGGCGADADIEA